MMRAAGLLAAVLVAGCAVARPAAEVVSEAAPAGACDASRVSAWVGRRLTPGLAAAARKRSGARAVRTITPDAMVTMDFRPDRLNLMVDANGVVTAVRCG